LGAGVEVGNGAGAGDVDGDAVLGWSLGLWGMA